MPCHKSRRVPHGSPCLSTHCLPSRYSKAKIVIHRKHSHTCWCGGPSAVVCTDGKGVTKISRGLRAYRSAKRSEKSCCMQLSCLTPLCCSSPPASPSRAPGSCSPHHLPRQTRRIVCFTEATDESPSFTPRATALLATAWHFRSGLCSIVQT